ncbi:MAG: hypothetical protein ABSE16_07495 [Verrucomicrobiota bacterium]|jgi:hypothetical protein
MKTISRLGLPGMFFGLLFLCSCATENSIHSQLPATVAMNKDAGRGGLLFVTLRLESGEKLPFVLDTGCPATSFDKSLEPKLGKCLDTGQAWNFGVEREINIYAAPKLYLGHTPLMMTGTNVLTYDCSELSTNAGRPVMGILGMDVLEHYCIQLDFKAGSMRFLSDKHGNKENWGKPFSLADLGNGCPVVSENLAGVKGSGSEIDTGCDSAGWLTPKLFQQWTNHAQLPATGEARSPDVVLGGETFPDADLKETDEKSILRNDAGVEFNGIGLHLLSRHLLTLDFPSQTMYLKRTSTFPLVDREVEAKCNGVAHSAMKFLHSLKQKGRLPGWSKTDKLAGNTVDFHIRLPDSGTCDAAKEGDSTIYHYQLSRASKSSPWKLEKAWRTDAMGKVIEEYPVP